MIVSGYRQEVDYTKYNNLYTLSDEFGIDEAVNVVTCIIMDEYEKALIERSVKQNYAYLDIYEQNRIAEKSLTLAREDLTSYEKRRASVKEKVKEYLNECGSIVPRGFVDFRMRELYYTVQEIVQKGADLFFDEKEYEEFVRLLSILVSEKEISEAVLHILWKGENVVLLNKRGRDVTDKYEKDFLYAAKEKGLKSEDLAISAVISANPEKLIIHSEKPSPLKETLVRIFGERAKVCTGCNICKKG